MEFIYFNILLYIIYNLHLQYNNIYIYVLVGIQASFFYSILIILMSQIINYLIINLSIYMLFRSFNYYGYLLLLTFGSFYKQISGQPVEMAQENNIFINQKTSKNKGNNYKVTNSGIVRSPETQSYLSFVQIENMKKIERFNANPNKTYTLERNAFITLTQDQVKRMYMGLIPSQSSSIKFAKALIQTKTQKQQQFKSKSIKQTSDNTILSNHNQNDIKLHKEQFIKNPALVLAPQTNVNVESIKIISASQLQLSVLQVAQNYFRKNNFDSYFIQNKTIPSYRFQGDLSKIPVIVSPQTQSRLLKQLNQESNEEIKDVDWTCISGRVKAQGNCNACYAYASLDNISAILAIYYLTFFIEFSVQEIIDCSKNSLTFGCQGGYMEGSFAYVISQGIYTSFTYPMAPYLRSSPKKDSNVKCRTDIHEKIIKWKISQLRNTKRGDCDAMKIKLLKHPLSVAIAVNYTFLYYKTGTLDGCSYKDQISHAVLLVGYKAGKGWKVKNSWGIKWGEEGYAWFKDGNTCGICELGGFYAVPQKNLGLDDFSSNKPLKKCPSFT